MAPRLRCLLLFSALLGSCTATAVQTDGGNSASVRSKVVILSIDGCRWDSLADEGLVNLRGMIDEGVHANQVDVTIPSMTAPGHVTLITGAWSGTHGVVFNKFYDRQQGLIKFFGGIPPEDQPAYLLAEPVWATAEKAGLTTAAVHWAATAGEYQGLTVDEAAPFDASWSDAQRVAEGVRLLRERRPDLLLIYTTGVSAATYQFGVGSPQVVEKLRSIDALIGELRDALRDLPDGDEYTLMVVSDHGFGPPLSKEICVSRVLADAGIPYEFILWGAIGHVFLKNQGDVAKVMALLEPLEGVEDVLSGEEAGALHLATQDRTGDVLVVTAPGYQVANQWRPCDAALVDVQPGYELAGTHGQPSADHPGLRGIFVAAGPAITPGKLGTVRQIDIAPTISAILGIPPPAQADGQALDILSPR